MADPQQFPDKFTAKSREYVPPHLRGQVAADAPFGRNYTTSAALSDKYRFAAGMLQVFAPGSGRMYIGYRNGAFLLAFWLFGWCTALFLIGIPILMIAYVIGAIDGLTLLTGRGICDAHGRELRW